MGYIVYAEFTVQDDLNPSDGKERILTEDGVRFLSENKESGMVTVDVQGDFKQIEQITLDLCYKLVKHGIYRFCVGHSF